jgi:integrase
LFRTGGRETTPRLAGTFKTAREARIRRDYVAGELAAMRVPDLDLGGRAKAAETVREACERWRASRIDVSEGTKTLHHVALNRATAVLGDVPVDKLTTEDVARLIEALVDKGSKRETIKKTIRYLANVLDECGLDENPARDRHLRLPHEERAEVSPPTGEHVLAVHRLLPRPYRLPLLVLDATGMRVGELEQLTWGDVDEIRGRWRVSQAVSKTGRARWVSVPPAIFEAVVALVPREDRTPERRVFQGFGADRFRTALTRACIASGVPAFSPHDLRHRRISLLHLSGVPWARIGEAVGQRNLSVTADTYSHVVMTETEIDYKDVLR